MSMNNRELKNTAIRMRKGGKSYGEISKTLDVAKSTLSYWLKSIPISKMQRSLFYTDRIRKLAEGPRGSRARRQKEIEIILAQTKDEMTGEITDNAYRLFGAGLYWAEGSKGGMLQITNSDPALIYFMVRWFEKMFAVNRKTFFAKLNIYSQQNNINLKEFWSDLSGIPIERFGKSYIKPSSKNVKTNNLYYGTIQITVPKSSDMKWRVFGWIQGALAIQNKHVSRNLVRWEHLRRVERSVNLR